MCGQNQVTTTMKEQKYIVLMQRSDKSVNNGIRLSNIFTSKRVAEKYAEDKRETEKFDIVQVLARSEWSTIPNA